MESANVLVVGAGGIGVEVLKNIALVGCKRLTVIDLDTIDVSNLNRQFLFRKEHVGHPKSFVAADAVRKMATDCDVLPIHDSVMNPKYNSSFFAKFDVVLNALDNRAARSHVNRMCLSAKIPLVESGSAGYFGQATVIQRNVSECYDCQPKAAQKTFPGCTIRNTPSEPVHCIVWAKHLFNQLFGESDPDEDVSPDTADPELAGSAAAAALEAAADDTERTSTRQWAIDSNYNAVKLFSKLFGEDIRYLLSMKDLWKTRRAPSPLSWPADLEAVAPYLDDYVEPSFHQNASLFFRSVAACAKQAVSSADPLVWDKDDRTFLEFVVSAANLRSHAFHIPIKSLFDVKAIAGNIIPAIATTNAIIAGLVVVEAVKILSNNHNECQTTYLNRQANWAGRLLVREPLQKPNPNCLMETNKQIHPCHIVSDGYVCAEKPEVTLTCNCSTMTCKQLEEKVLRKELAMTAPDVEVEDGKGTILISSEEGETDANNDRTLESFNIITGTVLHCDDFLQSCNLFLHIIDSREEIPDRDTQEPVEFIVSRIDHRKKGAPVQSVTNGVMTSGEAPDPSTAAKSVLLNGGANASEKQSTPLRSDVSETKGLDNPTDGTPRRAMKRPHADSVNN